MQGTTFLEQYPLIFYWTVALNFSRFETMFMLRMLCGEQPEIWPLHLWPMAFIGLYGFLHKNQIVSTGVNTMMFVYFVFTVVYFARTVKTLIAELCAVLNIFAFSIPS
eukprot:c11157_g1_i1.p1 GENE.c11157_g1_i1~~c11157_g1_i1.p1  ORF type:complete len:108 (+),score=24.61 c11157_g1_i1:63-386(+)